MKEFFVKYIEPTAKKYASDNIFLSGKIFSVFAQIKTALLNIVEIAKKDEYYKAIKTFQSKDIPIEVANIIAEMRTEFILKFKVLSEYFQTKKINLDLDAIRGESNLENLEKFLWLFLGESRYSTLKYIVKGKKKWPLFFLKENFQMDEKHVGKYKNDTGDFPESLAGDFVWQQVLLTFAETKEEGLQKLMQKVFEIEIFFPPEKAEDQNITKKNPQKKVRPFYGKPELLQNPKELYTEFFEQAFGQEESERIRKIIQEFQKEQKKIPYSLIKKDFRITTERFGKFANDDLVPAKDPLRNFKWVAILRSLGGITCFSISQYIQTVFGVEVDL